jgi:hypothetical protein
VPESSVRFSVGGQSKAAIPSKRDLIPAAIVGVIVLVLGLVGVHAYNIARLDPGAWRADAEPLLERAQAISERARPEYQDLALATLPPNPHNGSFYRLDDRLLEANVVERPVAATEADGAVLYAFDFDDAASPGLIAIEGGKAPLVEGGMLKMTGLKGRDRLTNADPIALPLDEIGDVVIRARERADLVAAGLVARGSARAPMAEPRRHPTRGRRRVPQLFR